MINKTNLDIREKILEGLRISNKKLIQNKKDRNYDIVISENGKVVKISPDKLTSKH